MVKNFRLSSLFITKLYFSHFIFTIVLLNMKSFIFDLKLFLFLFLFFSWFKPLLWTIRPCFFYVFRGIGKIWEYIGKQRYVVFYLQYVSNNLIYLYIYLYVYIIYSVTVHIYNLCIIKEYIEKMKYRECIILLLPGICTIKILSDTTNARLWQFSRDLRVRHLSHQAKLSQDFDYNSFLITITDTYG